MRMRMTAQSRPLGPYKEAIVAFFGLQRVILVLGRKIVVGVSDNVAHLNDHEENKACKKQIKASIK